MKKIFFIVAIVIGIVIINNLARSIFDTWSKKDLIVRAQNQLEAEKRENERLKSQFKAAEDPQFIEVEARNKLLLVKPGEETVIIPQDLASKSNEVKQDSRPNWEKWWSFFF